MYSVAGLNAVLENEAIGDVKVCPSFLETMYSVTPTLSELAVQVRFICDAEIA